MDFNEIFQYTQDIRVLYVEDDIDLQKETSEVLENYFDNISISSNGVDALNYYKMIQYDLIITDINMPIMDGEALIKEIHNINPQQEIIVISAYSDSERLMSLIQQSISNFILKPIGLNQLSNILYKTCKNIFARKRLNIYHQNIEENNKFLDKKVKELTDEITFTQQISLEAIADMVENYDNETGSHTKRIERFTSLLVEKIPTEVGCPPELREFVPFASLLHDIGKMFIPKDILNKPASLTSDEFMIIKTHSKLGGDMLNKANETFKQRFKKDSFLKVAADIAMYHHEKWDGSGYPNRLKGEEIPMCARIVAIVDVYDALRSKRVYKDGFSHKKSIEIIKSESDKHFDPIVVDAFLSINHKFDDIFNRLSKVG